ncbi:MAG: MarR family transcriptional regulator [Pseudomonadota bacterium]
MGSDLNAAARSRPSSLTVDYKPVFHELARVRAILFDAKLAPHGITISQAWVLVHLWQDDGLSQSTIAKRMDIATVTTSKLIDRLEGHGFVERKVDPNDRRSNLVVATQKGRTLMKVLTRIVFEVDEVANAGIDAADLETTLNVLGRMRRNLRMELARI